MTKKQVDNFREGKLIPHCQLKAEVIGKREQTSSLKHNISLTGVQYPHNILTIDLPAAKGIIIFFHQQRLCMMYALLQIFHARGIELSRMQLETLIVASIHTL